MERMSIPRLAERLNALAEAFDKKPVSLKAAEVWFDTLKEFETEMVLNILTGWAKSHPKFPVPAEVWKAANEINSEDMEMRAERRKVELHRAYQAMPRSEEGARILKMAIAAIGRTSPPIIHWRKTLDTPELPSISYRYANYCLKKIDPEYPKEEAA